MAQSVGRTYMVVISFLNSNEEIVVRNPKSKIFFCKLFVVLFVVYDFTIYTYLTLVKVAKLMASEARGLHSPSPF